MEEYYSLAELNPPECPDGPECETHIRWLSRKRYSPEEREFIHPCEEGVHFRLTENVRGIDLEADYMDWKWCPECDGYCGGTFQCMKEKNEERMDAADVIYKAICRIRRLGLSDAEYKRWEKGAYGKVLTLVKRHNMTVPAAHEWWESNRHRYEDT